MASRDGASSGSGFPGVRSLLGAEGNIDLSGENATEGHSEPPRARPSGDAWVIDRDRRSLPPPPPSDVETSVPSHAHGSLEEVTATTRDEACREIADRFALGDYAGALSAAELQLGREPEDEVVRRYADNSRELLAVRYATRIGSLEYVFNVSVPASKIKWLGLDPQAAFLLSLVDGQTTVTEVLDLCHMGKLEALRVFTELLDAKAIVRVA